MQSEKEKMVSGALYNARDSELQHDIHENHIWLSRYNGSLNRSVNERLAILRERLGMVGEGVVVRPPFHCDYGYNINLGNSVFLNFNCVILDVVEVTIGDGTQIGSGVQILTADHPRDPQVRISGLGLVGIHRELMTVATR